MPTSWWAGPGPSVNKLEKVFQNGAYQHKCPCVRMNSEKWLLPVSVSPVQVPVAPTSSWGSPRSARGSNPGPFQITSALGLRACEILCVPFKNTVCFPHPCGSTESNPHWLSRPYLPGAGALGQGIQYGTQTRHSLRRSSAIVIILQFVGCLPGSMGLDYTVSLPLLLISL